MRKSHHARENVYGVKNTEMGITVSILQIRKPEHLKHLKVKKGEGRWGRYTQLASVKQEFQPSYLIPDSTAKKSSISSVFPCLDPDI